MTFGGIGKSSGIEYTCTWTVKETSGVGERLSEGDEQRSSK